MSSTGTSAEEALFNATLENYAHLSRHYGTRHVRGSDFDLFHASLGDLEEYKNAAMTRKAEIDRFLGAIRDMTPESFAAASAFSHDVKRVVRIKLRKPVQSSISQYADLRLQLERQCGNAQDWMTAVSASASRSLEKEDVRQERRRENSSWMVLMPIGEAARQLPTLGC